MLLKNRNVLDKKVNKKLVNSMLAQAQKYTTDIPQTTGDTVSFTSLMKSLTYISLILGQVLTKAARNHQKIERFRDGAYSDGGDDDSGFFDHGTHRNREFSGTGRKVGGMKSSKSASRAAPQRVPGFFSPDSSSSQGDSFVHSTARSRPFQPSASRQNKDAMSLPAFARFASVIDSIPATVKTKSTNNSISKRLDFSGHPSDSDDGDDDDDDDDDDGKISELTVNTVNPMKFVIDTINVNALEKEAVNVKFITQSLEETFSSLTKIQKSKLKTLCTTIIKQMVAIEQFYPDTTRLYDQVINIFEMIAESIQIIEDRLQQAGEGQFEYEGAGRINSGLLKLHQPQQYVNYRNVNDNFLANLARRNN
jgi:hypothetical protein